MPLSRIQKGELLAMQSEIQHEINSIQQRQQELGKAFARIRQILNDTPTDNVGDPIPDEMVMEKFNKTKEEFAKIMPEVKDPKLKPNDT